MANKFWVGGTGTWDATTTTHWDDASGGAGGDAAPGVNDIAIFDAASGGGTVTVTWASGTVTCQGITTGAYTGHLDFSTSDNNVTLTAAGGWNGSGSGTRTISLGDGVWTLSASSGTPWNMSTVTGLVAFNCNGSTINMTGNTTSAIAFAGGGQTYNIVNFGPNSSLGGYSISGNNTFATLGVTAPTTLVIVVASTQIITNAFTWTGTASNHINVLSSATSGATVGTISSANNGTVIWGAIRGITCSGGGTFTGTNAINAGQNSGITITPPAAGTGGSVVGG